jgi:hypothetical protein
MKMAITHTPNNGIMFTDVAGDTYEYPEDMYKEIAAVLNEVPVSEVGQSDMNEVGLEIYTNQTYIDGERQKTKIKHIAFVVIYE